MLIFVVLFGLENNLKEIEMSLKVFITDIYHKMFICLHVYYFNIDMIQSSFQPENPFFRHITEV